MSGSFEFARTTLDGVILVKAKPFSDARGVFSRIFCSDELTAVGFDKPIAQINRSRTARIGTVRGLHFQRPPHAEKKLVTCLKGSVFDVAVDVREGSPSFLRWHAEILSEENRHSLIIPEGYAHGFQALTDDVELIYLHTAAYAPAFQGGLNVSDPEMGLRWPLQVHGLSERDRSHPLVASGFHGVPNAM